MIKRKLIRWFFETATLKEGFNLVRDGVVLAAQNTGNLKSTQEIVQDIIEYLKANPAIALIPASMINVAVTEAFKQVSNHTTNMEGRLASLEQKMTLMTKVVDKIDDKISNQE